jgi:uncharacterized membrane protein
MFEGKGPIIMATAAAVHTGARRVFGFVKTTFIGGVVFLAPVAILGVLLVKAGRLLQRIARPLGAFLPLDRVLGVIVADVVIVLVVVLACFGAGLLAHVSMANRFLKKAEAGVLWRIPGYGFVKTLTASLDKKAATEAMRPVLVHFDDYAQLAFEIERLADGRRVVYVPGAPEPRNGAVLVFDGARVEPVPLGFVGAITSLRALGRGSSQWLK